MVPQEWTLIFYKNEKNLASHHTDQVSVITLNSARTVDFSGTIFFIQIGTKYNIIIGFKLRTFKKSLANFGLFFNCTIK